MHSEEGRNAVMPAPMPPHPKDGDTPPPRAVRRCFCVREAAAGRLPYLRRGSGVYRSPARSCSPRAGAGRHRAAAPRSRIFSIDDKTLTIALHSRVARVSYAHRPQEPLESVMHLILDFVLVMAAAVPPGLRYIRRTRVADDWDPY